MLTISSLILQKLTQGRDLSTIRVDNLGFPAGKDHVNTKKLLHANPADTARKQLKDSPWQRSKFEKAWADWPVALGWFRDRGISKEAVQQHLYDMSFAVVLALWLA